MAHHATGLAGLAAEALIASGSSGPSSRETSGSPSHQQFSSSASTATFDSMNIDGSSASQSSDADVDEDADEMDDLALPDAGNAAHQGGQTASDSDDTAGKGESDVDNITLLENDDEDDIYNAVDFISDSDGENSTFEEQETAHILHDFEGDAISNLGEFNLHHDGSLFPGDMPYFADQMRRIVYSNLAENLEEEESMKSPVFGAIPSAPSPPPPSPTFAFRRVRFDPNSILTPRSTMPEVNAASSNDMCDDNLPFSACSGFESIGDTTDEDEVPINATKSPRALLRQPTWDMDVPESPPPSGPKSRRLQSCSRKKPSMPRVASWSVHPGKALAQSDENHKVVIMTPVIPGAERECVCKNQARLPPSDLVTGLLQKEASTVDLAASSNALATRVDGSQAASTADPLPPLVSISGNNVAIPEVDISSGSITKVCGSVAGSVVVAGDPYCPASELIHDLQFAAANSDHESTDLDIMDYITFSSASEDETCVTDDEEPFISLANTKDNGEIRELINPLPTPDSSTTQTTPSAAEKSFQPSLMGSLRRDLTKSKSPVHMRKPHRGLALSRPATRAGLRPSITPPKFDKKRKSSDTHLGVAKRPNMRRASTNLR